MLNKIICVELEYLKPFNCEQYVKPLCANKWLISNKIISVKEQYLKSVNCVQTNV